MAAHFTARLADAFTMESVDRLAALVLVREQLDAHVAIETAALDGKGAFEGRSYRSSASFLVDDCRISRTAARKYLNAGRAMKGFPQLTSAATSGEITFDHVRLFANTVVPPRATDERRELAQSHEAEFLAKAKAYSADDFHGLCKAWRGIADFDCPEAQKRIMEKTDVQFSENEADGSAEIRIVGPRLDVIMIHKAITKIADQLWRKDNGEKDENVAPLRHQKGAASGPL